MTSVGYQTVESAQAPADRRHQTVVTVTGVGYQTVESAQAPADHRHQTELWADGEAAINVNGSIGTLSGSTLVRNTATGGAGGVGGNGLGGGVFNDATASLTILGSVIVNNEADGGAAGSGGSDGQGVGAGGYFAAGGNVCLDAFTQAHVKNNHASTSDDDIFGVFTTCP